MLIKKKNWLWRRSWGLLNWSKLIKVSLVLYWIYWLYYVKGKHLVISLTSWFVLLWLYGTEAKALLCATLKPSKKASINGHYLFGLFGVVFQNICCHFLAMTLQIITLNRPFPSSPGLCFKTRVGVQPLIRKSFFILMQIKLIFTIKVVHQASYWKWRF